MLIGDFLAAPAQIKNIKPMETRLIVTADDFGLSSPVNHAVGLAAREGILTAASLMASGSAFREAAQMADLLPSLQVGLHLSLTGGRPLTSFRQNPFSRLLLKRGRFRESPALMGLLLQFCRPVRGQIEAEVAAQFRSFRKTGLPLDHVDAHHHLHMNPRLFDMILKNGRSNGLKSVRIPFEPWEISRKITRSHWIRNRLYRGIFPPLSARCRRRADASGVLYADGVFGLYRTGEWTEDGLMELLDTLAGMPGVFELYTHPSEEKGSGGDKELEALLSPRVRGKVDRTGIRLIRYRDLAES